MVQLTDSTGAVVQEYTYDAFGVEKDQDASDANPFRYCGEYYDKETGLYYLRARYYSPELGRFLSEDTHWNISNMIYGDEPVKWNEKSEGDPLGLNTYTYLPSAAAIRQSGNLYTYGINNPISYVDPFGEVITPANVIGALVGAGIGGLLGIAIAKHFGLTGWKKDLAIAGGTALVGVAGWFAGAAILNLATKVTMSAISSGKLALTSLSANIIKALNLGQQAAQNAINRIGDFRITAKHLMSAGGNYGKFLSDSREVINQWVSQALTMANQFTVNSTDSFITTVYMGRTVGTNGEQYIKIAFSTAGKIIPAYPVFGGK